MAGRMIRALVILALLGAAGGAAAQPPAAWLTLTGAPPIVIGHRGAPGYRPEHTLASYDLAIALGVDFIEPDLVSTRDGVLIARHENEISGTTDVAEKFPERRTRKLIDGKPVEGWFSEDFTLAEIRTLRARERLPSRNQGWNGVYPVPTFDEVLALARQRSAETGRTIGVYPETKHPSHFRAIGLPLEPPLLRDLAAAGHVGLEAPVFIQSFEVQNLKDLRRMTRLRLVQLLEAPDARPWDFVAAGDPRTYGDLMTPAGLAEIATYADGIGPNRRSLLPQGPDKRLLAPTPLVADAHRAGLLVHAWTFRDEPAFLAPDHGLDPVAEYLQVFRLGVDGVFSDFGDTALRARARLGR